MNFPDPNLPPIVIIDDSQEDVFDLRYRLRLGTVTNPVVSFENVAAALPYLRSTRIVAAVPALIFLDLKMPGAAKLIVELRDEAAFDDVKIVIATYSNDPADLQHAFDLRVDGYLLKFPPPDDLAEFVRHGPWFAVPRRIDNSPHALCA